MRVRALVRSLLCLALFASLPAGAIDLRGDWKRSEARRSSDALALETEILQATEGMSVLVRGISRAFVRRHVRPTEHYRIDEEAGELVIRDLDSGTVWHVDGRIERSETGEVSSHLEASDRILQLWSHGDTRGSTLWRFGASGEELAITIIVREERLPGPLRYTVHYERSDSP